MPIRKIILLMAVATACKTPHRSLAIINHNGNNPEAISDSIFSSWVKAYPYYLSPSDTTLATVFEDGNYRIKKFGLSATDHYSSNIFYIYEVGSSVYFPSDNKKISDYRSLNRMFFRTLKKKGAGPSYRQRKIISSMIRRDILTNRIFMPPTNF